MSPFLWTIPIFPGNMHHRKALEVKILLFSHRILDLKITVVHSAAWNNKVQAGNKSAVAATTDSGS